MPASFDQFFHASTGNAPYDYQRRLAESPCESRLISIPTGLGKTAAIVLAWLWNRAAAKYEIRNPESEIRDPAAPWPRRLVYCLPMRTLVEQTRDEAEKWITELIKKDLITGKPPRVVVLMGGEELDGTAKDWDIYPEEDAILIGTQDMLLSRALNRGYGSPRARWPMHFGLFNNDALWVLDETQLMGVGVRTSAQLEGLRQKIGTALGCVTWWASATLDSRLLVTPDHCALPPTLQLGPSDLKDPGVVQRIEGVKRLAPLPLTLISDAAKAADPYIEALSAIIPARHQTDTTTIVILNRVDRAKDLHTALDKLSKKQNLPPRLLVHSRFRPLERDPLSKQIKEPGEKIIIATQAIEAGVDISARTLITELAPWSSLVQRFGRCNRKGEFNDTGGADIFWINLEAEDPKAANGLALPYAPEQLAAARAALRQAEATGVSPATLDKLRTDEPLPESHILRRKDLIDLFDTTPDLAGLDIDVGRYIRSDEDRDVQVYWREFGKDAKPPEETITPQRRELVRVPLHAFRKFYEKNKTGGIWLWDVLGGEWQPVRLDRIAPGQVYLIDSSLGGYSITLGWTGEKSKESFPILSLADQTASATPRDGQDKDEESMRSPSAATDAQAWQSIETHTAHVITAAQTLLTAFPTATLWAEAILTAARWHDVGKAHACFQAFITQGREVPSDLQAAFIAKAPWKAGARHQRPHFRHELASALAWIQAGQPSDPLFQNLVAYLIATHHGKVRLSLRSMPGEKVPDRPSDSTGTQSPLFARGIWQDDQLPSDQTKHLTLDGVPAAPHTLPLALDLTCMQMGEQDGHPSWTSRMLSLRDTETLGLFRLAWLETLLRSADARGSKQ